MSARNFPGCTHAVITFLYILCVFPGDGAQNTDNYSDSFEESDPWETPLKELQRVAPTCSLKISGFNQRAYDAEVNWQSCIDSITPKFPILESRRGRQEIALNDSVILELDRQLHMAICSNTTAYKGCWLSIIAALNECQEGVGDIAGKVYFALYEDICRDGERITVENRRKAAVEGRACQRNYSTKECSMNKMLRHSSDLCMRFQSNTACDLSSIDPNCSNKVDKRLHAEIFERVGKVLQCTPTQTSTSTLSSSSNGGNRIVGYSSICIFTIFLVFIKHIYEFSL